MVRDHHAAEVRVPLPERVDRLEQVFARGDVEAGGRLVEEQQTRLAMSARAMRARPRSPWDSTGQRESTRASSPTSATCRRAVATWSALGSHRIMRSVVPVSPVSTVSSTVSGESMRVSRVDVPDVLAELPDVDATEPTSEQLDGARRRVPGRTEHGEQGRLARAVRTQQRPVLAAADGQRHVVQQVPPGAGDAEGFGFSRTSVTRPVCPVGPPVRVPRPARVRRSRRRRRRRSRATPGSPPCARPSPGTCRGSRHRQPRRRGP